MPSNTPVRVVSRLEDLPDNPSASAFVIVDVAFFSSTVTSLLHHGADAVIPSRDLEHVRELRREQTVVGGIDRDRDDAPDDIDFVNYPSSAIDAIEPGDVAALSSRNGGRAVQNVITERDDSPPLYLGGIFNAAWVAQAVVQRLKENTSTAEQMLSELADAPIWVVATGADGTEMDEDTYGARLIEAWLNYHLGESNGVWVKLFEWRLWLRTLSIAVRDPVFDLHSDAVRVRMPSTVSTVPVFSGDRFVPVSP